MTMPRRATPPPTRYAYQLWDVFTDTRLSGNPLAVLPDAQGLSGESMQALAREFNLSETSFLLPSKSADVHARYFTPDQELPMAGHPSIGSVYALDYLGRASGDELVLKLGIGPVTMRLERDGEGLERVWMDQGVPSFGQRYPNRAKVAALLNLEETDLDPALPVQEVSAGVPFVIVAVNSLGALGHARVTEASLASFMGDEPRAVLVVTRHVGKDEGAEVRARMLGLAVGVAEDPATGSAHGPLGAYLAKYGGLELSATMRTTFVSHQGVEMGRPSRIDVEVTQTPDGFRVAVGGSAVLVGEGTLYL